MNVSKPNPELTKTLRETLKEAKSDKAEDRAKVGASLDKLEKQARDAGLDLTGVKNVINDLRNEMTDGKLDDAQGFTDDIMKLADGLGLPSGNSAGGATAKQKS